MVAASQTPAPTSAVPPYQSLRYDEDWTYLKDPAKRTDPWDSLKHIVLKEPDWYLSLGGELRVRYELFDNAAFGSGSQDENGYVLQRYLAHADLHVSRVRLFTQLQSGIESGRIGGPRATDEDVIDVHQAFVDVIVIPGRRALTVRTGRQEVEFGSGRLISASEGLNVRRAFDAVRPILRTGVWTWNGLLAKLVDVRRGPFDDSRDRDKTFWGAGLIRLQPEKPEAGTSAYYLGLTRREARFSQGIARERRHTLGARRWGTHRRFDYNYEGLLQWGAFSAARVRAWAVASDTGYQVRRAVTRIGVRFDLTSGDRRLGDNRLQTFNPLFPGTAYSGRVGLIGPANSIDVAPSARVRVSPRVSMTADAAAFWRQSTADGIYGINTNLIRDNPASRARGVGFQPSLTTELNVNRHLAVTVVFTRFQSGRFLRETPPGGNVSYLTVWSTYRF
jgi:alginate export protein